MEYIERDAQMLLIERLRRGTARDKYSWKPSKDNDYRFSLAAGDFVFVISSRDKDDYAPFLLEIYRHSPEGGFKKLQVVETEPDVAELSLALEDLYVDVKRKTLRLEIVADELFGALDSLEDDEQ